MLSRFASRYVATRGARTLFSLSGLSASHDPGQRGSLTREQILRLPSMPAISPSYPLGPYRFRDREYFIVTYRSDPAAIAKRVPEPLVPNADNIVLYEWIAMPDSQGFGAYQESGIVIPCTFQGKQVNYTSQMFLDCEPPIACGREIWGFPKKYAKPCLQVRNDTLTGTLVYSGEKVAIGTMCYKYKAMPHEQVVQSLSKTCCNLKIIPRPDWSHQVSQLVSFNLQDLEILHAYEGPARLHLSYHINAPVADLPVLEVLGGRHIKAHLTLPHGQVLYDYTKAHSGDKCFQVLLPDSDPFVYDVQRLQGKLTREAILSAPSMPVVAPSYKGGKNMLTREILGIFYQTTASSLAKVLPDCVTANADNVVMLQWTKNEGSGFAEYEKVSMHIPCTYNGKSYNFSVATIADTSAVITAGREALGQPYKFGAPKLIVANDTLIGRLDCGGERVATASMVYNHTHMNLSDAYEILQAKELNLKLIPNVNGEPEIAQLVSVDIDDVIVKCAWQGPARIELIPHVCAPFADLPVEKVLQGYHIKADMMLSGGNVEHDYLAEMNH